MNTRGRVEDQILGGSLFYFFCRKSAEKRESLETKRKYLFPFPRQREEEKVGNRSNRHKKEAALQRLRRNNKNNRVCVCIHLI